jgi:hypothetical protein
MCRARAQRHAAGAERQAPGRQGRAFPEPSQSLRVHAPYEPGQDRLFGLVQSLGEGQSWAPSFVTIPLLASGRSSGLRAGHRSARNHQSRVIRHLRRQPAATPGLRTAAHARGCGRTVRSRPPCSATRCPPRRSRASSACSVVFIPLAASGMKARCTRFTGAASACHRAGTQSVIRSRS